MIQRIAKSSPTSIPAPDSEIKKSSSRHASRRQKPIWRTINAPIHTFRREWVALLSGIGICLLVLCSFSPLQSSSAQMHKSPDITESAEPEQTASVTADQSPEDCGFIEPIPAWSSHISSTFGGRQNPLAEGSENHKGVDIAMAEGTEIHAVQDGEVTLAEDNGNGYGKHVMLMHDDVLITLYGHCSELLVTAGQQVKQGDVIALVGSTGNSTGPHLHFEVRENGKAVDPTPFLPEG